MDLTELSLNKNDLCLLAEATRHFHEAMQATYQEGALKKLGGLASALESFSVGITDYTGKATLRKESR